MQEQVQKQQMYVSTIFPPMNQGNPELGGLLEALRFGTAKERKDAADDLSDHRGTQAVAALINVMVNDSLKYIDLIKNR